LSLKLLVVEYDPASLELMSEVLRSLEAEVRPFSNSQEAAALVHQQKFDGIFLDLEMPNLDGLALAQEVRTSS
jgi:CheY-like chemotaxis protein